MIKDSENESNDEVISSKSIDRELSKKNFKMANTGK